VAAVAVLGALGVFLTRRAAAPRPVLPTVESLGAVAPEVADAAREALDDLAREPRDAQRWGRFGMICEANGIIGAARDAYATATTLDSGEAKWWYRLAMVEARTGRTDDAVAAMRRATELSATYAPAHWRLGLWLLDRDDTDGAERAFVRAREIDPRDVSAALGLARVYLQRRQDQPAADLLERTLANNPGDRYAMQLLGTAYRRLGRTAESEFALAVGESGEPAWPDPWTDEMMQYRRGFAVRLKDATQYFVAGRMAEAMALLQQLRLEKPDDLALLDHLGEVSIAAGKLDEGVAMLEQVVARDPERFETQVNRVPARRGHTDERAPVFLRPGDVGRRLVAGHEPLVRVHERVRDRAEALRVPQQPADVVEARRAQLPRPVRVMERVLSTRA